MPTGPGGATGRRFCGGGGLRPLRDGARPPRLALREEATRYGRASILYTSRWYPYPCPVASHVGSDEQSVDLLNEKRARRFAAERGFTVIGTVGVVLRAHRGVRGAAAVVEPPPPSGPRWLTPSGGWVPLAMSMSACAPYGASESGAPSALSNTPVLRRKSCFEVGAAP